MVTEQPTSEQDVEFPWIGLLNAVRLSRAEYDSRQYRLQSRNIRDEPAGAYLVFGHPIPKPFGVRWTSRLCGRAGVGPPASSARVVTA
jgi:hypothetical protein